MNHYSLVQPALFLSSLILLLLGTVGCSPTQLQEAAAQSSVPEPQLTQKQPGPPPQSFGLQNPNQDGFLPDRLTIAPLDLDIPVVELGWSSKAANGAIFSEWDVAEYAAGWHKNSALLNSKEVNGGNVVMSGHNNILGSVFRELDQLKRGDEITVWSGSRPFVYTVDKVLIVPEKYATLEQRRANATWIGSFADERLTLVSCWPRDDNTHRIVVVAHPRHS